MVCALSIPQVGEWSAAMSCGIIYGMKSRILIVAALLAASAPALPNGGI